MPDLIAITLLAQDTHCNVENRRVVQRDDAPVRTRFEMHADTLFRAADLPVLHRAGGGLIRVSHNGFGLWKTLLRRGFSFAPARLPFFFARVSL